MKTLPPFANKFDLEKCIEIVKNEAESQNLKFDDLLLTNITISIMNISYSIGGNYSPKMIKQIAQNYFSKKLFNEQSKL
ncbi:hypothetical protein CAPN006_21680 [Capnocytophaga canimorsus]|uniref:hypothetical protein n=1 Tax=Capnocytophaga canimorsus TaxID=28188 RepID=UPI001AD3684A|nr:hypothetical protein [Capnocytophaga canimorsus]GIM57776.1 hypothetical protein CAPN006_21680 [Capnocytophaga canimorsus]